MSNLGCLSGKRTYLQSRKHRRHVFGPSVGKIPWRRKWQPTPAFLPTEFHGQRSLAGYSPWGLKESDTSEWLSIQTHTSNKNHTSLRLFSIFFVYLLVLLLTIYQATIFKYTLLDIKWKVTERSLVTRRAECLQSCPTFCDPIVCSTHGSCVHVILQAGILQWISISFCRGSSWPRDWSCVSSGSCIGKCVLFH